MPTEPVNVLVTTPIEQEYIDQIAAVSPRLRVRNVSDLAKADQEGNYVPGSEFDTVLAEADVIYGLRLPRNFGKRAPRLKWVQVMSAGVDRFLDDGLRKSAVTLTNVSGIHATPIGEFVLEQMLMFAKGAALCFDLKQKRQWRRFGPTVLRDKTVGLIGQHALDALPGLEMKLDPEPLVRGVDETVRMAPISVHVWNALGNSSIREQNGHLMKCLRYL